MCHYIKLLFIVHALTAGALVLRGQPEGTARITGRVYNPATQEYVRSAEVRLEGGNQIVATQGDGTFQFERVPAGQAT